jgi:hypothetical protein
MLLASASVLLLSGCSSSFIKPGPPSTSSAQAADYTAKGRVHGGQFPVQGSTVNVYAASTSGYGTASTNVTTLAGSTTLSGQFSVSYHCTTGQYLYLVATGGDPLNDNNYPTENNTALVLTAAMGPCGNLFTGISGSYNITEVTTVATEYALAPFSTGYLDVGTSSTNTTGLANAFYTVTNLVNLSEGVALSVTPGYPAPGSTNGTNTPPDVFSSIVPADTINSIANSIASCVNTINSGTTTLSPQCSNPSGPSYGLFDYTGGNQSLASGNGVNNSPNANTTLNTADAALYIAHNPGLPSVNGFAEATNVGPFLNLAGAAPPFASPVLTTTPYDLTLTLNYLGGGLGGVGAASGTNSSYMAFDSADDIWVVNPGNKSISELNYLGVPVTGNTTVNSTSPYGLISAGGYKPGFTTAASAQSLAIDLSNNVWVADSSNACLAGVTSAGSTIGTFPSLCPNTGAKGVAVDPNSNIWVSSGPGTPFVFEATYSGGTLAYTSGTSFTNPYSTSLVDLVGYIQADEAGQVWFSDNGNGSLDSLPNTANMVPNVLDGAAIFGAMGPYTGSNDAPGGGLDAWIPEASNYSFQQVNVTGSVATEDQPAAILPTTFTAPTGVAIDGNSYGYFANAGGTAANDDDITVPPNITVYTKNNTQVSPYNSGYSGGSNFVFLDSPKAVAVDQSGNLWVLNNANKSANLSHTGQGVGPYAGDYVGNGTQDSNLVEFVGLAAPVTPVLASQAAAGKAGGATAAGTYGVKP